MHPVPWYSKGKYSVLVATNEEHFKRMTTLIACLPGCGKGVLHVHVHVHTRHTL